MKKNLFKLKLPAFLFISLWLQVFSYAESVDNVCKGNIFQQVYPNQDSCDLFISIPKEFKHLPYIIYPTTDAYNTARFNYNKRFNIFPHAVITPYTAEQVIHVLNVLKNNHLTFSVRSGGHCYEPGSLSNGYVLDMRNFNNIIPNLEKEEVFIGAGCRLGAVIETLAKIHRAIPTGTCASVGITGLSLGGGIGMLARTYGLACDAIKSITLVDADAKQIEVSADSNPDLFWALRGAGNGSFGIVLGITFKMYPVKDINSFELDWDWNADVVPKIIHAWQSWLKKLPPNVNSQLHIWYVKGKPHIAITGLKVGLEPFTEWKEAFEVLNPRVNIYKDTYLESAQRWAGSSPVPFYKAKSKVLIDPLSDEVIDTTVSFFEKMRNNKEKYLVYFEIDALGGKVQEGDSAFYPRKAWGWWQQLIRWHDQDCEGDALKILRDFYNSVSDKISPYSYTNCVDYDLGDDFLTAYFGDHAQRLMSIKRKYDPDNIFHWRQSIPLEKGSASLK